MKSSAIYLKAYTCPDGREIHYSCARLRRDPNSSTTILDMPEAEDPDHNTVASSKMPCWIYFYPMGPNRRMLEAIIKCYAPKFECDKEVLFMCINRPGKGGTSSSIASTKQHHGKTTTDERHHVQTSVDDIITILDYHGIRKTNLLYMCAGSTFAYSFASKYPDRTTGYILGIASWVLRSDPSSANHGDVKTPQMHSLTHRLAMQGYFGPKWFVSNLVGGVMGSVSVIFSSVPPGWVGHQLKKDLSQDEILKFEEQYPDVEEFVELMKWIHNDGCDDEANGFAISSCGTNDTESVSGNKKEGDAKDVAVCLSTQQDLGLIYKSTVPPQRQVLLWHGEDDKMIYIAGSKYLKCSIPNANLTRIAEGTHQGVMFCFPDEALEALNRISRDAPV